MIEIIEYDVAWPLGFEAERDRVTPLLASWLVSNIEHVGSTAVPGMAAKPVIDLMAPVAGLEESAAAIPVLTGAGYHYAPYKADCMHWFCRPSPEVRTHHLHLVPVDSRLWHERLAFRDALRADATLAAAYATLKRTLAVRFADDREAYTEGKSAFIADAIRTSVP